MLIVERRVNMSNPIEVSFILEIPKGFDDLIENDNYMYTRFRCTFENPKTFVNTYAMSLVYTEDNDNHESLEELISRIAFRIVIASGINTQIRGLFFTFYKYFQTQLLENPNFKYDINNTMSVEADLFKLTLDTKVVDKDE